MGGNSSKESPSSTKNAAPSPPQSAASGTAPSTSTPFTGKEDYDTPLKRKALPKELQSMINDEEEQVWEQVYEGHGPDSTGSSVRYAAYANRIRTILISAQRYVAYTSDIGESFRPIAHPYLVRGAYGISWAYLIGDVSNEGYKAYTRQRGLLYPQEAGVIHQRATNATGADGTMRELGRAVASGDTAGMKVEAGKLGHEMHDGVNEAGKTLTSMIDPPKTVPAIEDYRSVMVQRAVFQSLASMGLPAFTIHSVVRYSGRALKDVKNVRLRTWGPIGLGLAIVPALPFIFDKPVEEAVEWTFHKGFEFFGGPDAVGNSPSTGREMMMTVQTAAMKKLEEKKEL